MTNWTATEWILLLVGMAAVTQVSRLLPVLVLGKKKLPMQFSQFVRFVPSAVLAAAIAPAILVHQGRLNVHVSNSFLLAAIPTLLVGYFSKNLLLSVAVGMIAVTLLRTY